MNSEEKMNKFLRKIEEAARRSKEPRKLIISMILKAHGWRNPWRTAAWYPPGESITFGSPVTVEALKRRGYGGEADHLMTVENMLMNWAAATCGSSITWDRKERDEQ